MTLIELLAVIVIITTLVAAAIPLLSPANDDRRIREASRGLNTYILGAQSRAVSSHRPFGIALKRLSQDTTKPEDRGACVEVFYVEQPAPYSGFDQNSRACVALYPDQNFRPGIALIRFVTRSTTAVTNMPIGWAGDLFPSGMIRPGDVISINGTEFELLGDPSSINDAQANIRLDPTLQTFFEPKNAGLPPQILARPLNDSGQQIGPRYDNKGGEIGSSSQSPYWTNPAPYKVLRQAALASDEPYQMPEGTAIDLRASGVGSDNYFFWPGVRDNDDQIQIMFTPEGRVARVTYSMAPRDSFENDTDVTSNPSDLFDQAVAENVYLLVGRRDRIPAPPVTATGTPHDSSLNPTEVNAATTDEQKAKLKEPLNWLNGSSRWVVLGSLSGRVATIENANVDMADLLSTPPPPPFNTALPSSEEMRCAQILKAREFTHEMKQVGGR